MPSLARTILASSIKALMDAKYRDSKNRPLALAKDAKVTLSTVQRLLDPTVGENLDTIEAVARVFHLEAYELLMARIERPRPSNSPARKGGLSSGSARQVTQI